MPPPIGKQYNWWTIEPGEPENRGGSMYYPCKCKCGALRHVKLRNLVENLSRSCGCYQKVSVSTHGKTRTPIYILWRNMKVRCFVTTNKDYPNYGGRGVTVCERWKDSFDDFYADVGDLPAPGYELDRINNDGNYEPGNVRWATRKEQLRNRRNTKFYEHEGVTKPIVQWAEEHGVEPNALTYRLLVKKMSFVDAVTVPMRKYVKRKPR